MGLMYQLMWNCKEVILVLYWYDILVKLNVKVDQKIRSLDIYVNIVFIIVNEGIGWVFKGNNLL